MANSHRRRNRQEKYVELFPFLCSFFVCATSYYSWIARDFVFFSLRTHTACCKYEAASCLIYLSMSEVLYEETLGRDNVPRLLNKPAGYPNGYPFAKYPTRQTNGYTRGYPGIFLEVWSSVNSDVKLSYTPLRFRKISWLVTASWTYSLYEYMIQTIRTKIYTYVYNIS